MCYILIVIWFIFVRTHGNIIFAFPSPLHPPTPNLSHFKVKVCVEELLQYVTCYKVICINDVLNNLSGSNYFPKFISKKKRFTTFHFCYLSTLDTLIGDLAILKLKKNLFCHQIWKITNFITHRPPHHCISPSFQNLLLIKFQLSDIKSISWALFIVFKYCVGSKQPQCYLSIWKKSVRNKAHQWLVLILMTL